MAGYAARDKNGTVEVSETAPSSRWVEVINRKGSPFVLEPDTTDNVIYIDELLNFIINDYGTEVNVNFLEVVNSAVSISIYDISGRKLEETNVIPFGTTVNIGVEYFMSGIYFLQVQTGDSTISEKFLLL